MTVNAITSSRSEPIVKAHDVAYVRFSAPDLDLMETFVKDFGLVVVHRDEDMLISRGLEASPYLHVVHRGPAKFIGWSFLVNSEADLQKLADEVSGCSPVHDIGGPEGKLGGGRRVHFIEPLSGFVLEAVHGQTAEAIAPERPRSRYNQSGHDGRPGVLQDIGGNRSTLGGPGGPVLKDPGPPEVMRLAHCVAVVPPGAHHQFMRFLAETFGMLPTDIIQMNVPPGAEANFPPPLVQAFKESDSNVLAQFMRMDRGKDYTDHHSVFVLPQMDPRAVGPGGTPQAQLSHASFEVFNIDDVFKGHMSFREKEAAGAPYRHAWGIGRHVAGSQIYDYWHDPYGHVHEHMSDGDRINVDYGYMTVEAANLVADQWGPTVAESGIHHLDGPQCNPRYEELSDDIRASLISRDLTDLKHIIESL